MPHICTTKNILGFLVIIAHGSSSTRRQKNVTCKTRVYLSYGSFAAAAATVKILVAGSLVINVISLLSKVLPVTLTFLFAVKVCAALILTCVVYNRWRNGRESL